MQVHESAVKELQEQLGQKATTVDSLHQDTQQLQQQLSEQVKQLSAVHDELDAANAGHAKTAQVSSMPLRLTIHCLTLLV